MKTNRWVWAAWALIIVFCLVSCRANLEVRKKQEEASRDLAEVFIGQGDYTSALRELLKAEKFYSEDPFLQNDLGFVYKEKEKYDLAIKHFKKALELKPDFMPAKNNLGTAYLAKKDWDAAIACFEEIIDDLLYTTPQNPLFNLGLVYYQKKDYQNAEKYFLDCLKYYKDGFQKDPTYIKALYHLGQIYIESERIPEAIGVLEKAAEDAPESAQLYFSLGNAYVLANDNEKAFHAYNKVIELAPDTPLAREAGKKAALIKNSQ